MGWKQVSGLTTWSHNQSGFANSLRLPRAKHIQGEHNFVESCKLQPVNPPPSSPHPPLTFRQSQRNVIIQISDLSSAGLGLWQISCCQLLATGKWRPCCDYPAMHENLHVRLIYFTGEKFFQHSLGLQHVVSVLPCPAATHAWRPDLSQTLFRPIISTEFWISVRWLKKL